MEEEELREKIFDAIMDMTCRVCESWDYDARVCFLQKYDGKCRRVARILNLIKEAGYVKLADWECDYPFCPRRHPL